MTESDYIFYRYPRNSIEIATDHVQGTNVGSNELSSIRGTFSRPVYRYESSAFRLHDQLQVHLHPLSQLQLTQAMLSPRNLSKSRVRTLSPHHQSRLTQPLSWGYPNMLIPLAVFNTFFRDEASFKRDKLVINSLNPFERFQQSPPWKPERC